MTSPPDGWLGVAGKLNPEFEGMFRVLFKVVMAYLDSKGWGDSGSWAQVIDEPSWTNNATFVNTLAIMKLYKSVDSRIKIYQTRWPMGGGTGGSTNTGSASSITADGPPGMPPYALELLDEVDWWCPHVCQWTFPGVPEAMAALRAKRQGGSRPLHITVYDNGVPIIESPWERLRTQPLDVWISNGTLDGTLSWYSVNSYPRNADPWLHPYTTPSTLSNGTEYLKDPAGWGYLLWPLPPGLRKGGSWVPVESVRWVMTGAGIQDAEYLYTLQKKAQRSAKVEALLAQARSLATGF